MLGNEISTFSASRFFYYFLHDSTRFCVQKICEIMRRMSNIEMWYCAIQQLLIVNTSFLGVDVQGFGKLSQLKIITNKDYALLF